MDKELLAKAILDPPSIFHTPADVLADRSLTRPQKIEILRRWEYDACEVSVAEEEGMPVRNGGTLRLVLEALHELVGNIDTGATPPTKQGGLVRDALTRAPRKR